MNADVKQTTKVSAHVETSGWGKVVLNSAISLPQRHWMLNQWQRSITRSVFNTGLCLGPPPISFIIDVQCIANKGTVKAGRWCVVCSSSSSAGLLQLVELTLVDSSYILRVMFELNVIPLALQITTICGNVMVNTSD